MNPESRLFRLQLLGSLALVLTLALALGGYFIRHDIRLFEGSLQDMEQEVRRNHRTLLEQEAANVKSYLEHLRTGSERLLKERIRAEVDQAMQIVETLYHREQGWRDPADLRQLIIETLRPLRFFAGRGYFFIDDLQGTCILLPTAPEREGSSLWDNRDDTGHYIMRDLARAAQEPVGAGFSRYRWYAPGDNTRMADKIAYVRRFEPYGWIIGAGEYLDTFRADLQREALGWIRTIRFNTDGHVVIIANDGTLLASPSTPDQEGQHIQSLSDPRMRDIAGQILTLGRDGGGFLDYLWFRPADPTQTLLPKMAYVTPLSGWDWTLLTGLYLHDLDMTLHQRRAALQHGMHDRIWNTVWIVLLAATATVALSVLYARWLRGVVAGYQRDLGDRTVALYKTAAALDQAHSAMDQAADERKLTEERLRHLAEYDELTGLPNRALLQDRLHQAVTSAARSGHRLAVLFLNLDRFKTINDSLGYQWGDQVLQEAARRLRITVRASDTLSRHGSDEFVALLPDILHSHQVAAVAEKLVQAMAQPYQPDAQQEELVVTLSIGISVYPEDGRDVDSLLRNAAVALNNAKQEGRNGYRFFAPIMDARAHARLSLETRLRRALERGEFQLHYQPQFQIADGRLIGYEALVRWSSHDQLISPAQFIPVAEECGLILPLGAWVLKEACRQNQVWRDRGLAIQPVAVNLSAVQFRRRAVIATVMDALQSSGLDPGDLELELTESVLMENPEQASTPLRELKAMGIRLAIDDFGTGYSSLSYLKRFPLDTLKIDRAFIQGLPADRDDAAITTAIIRLAKNLELTTVAEGVETEAQRAFLLAQGCDRLQGFLWSRPLPATELEALLRQGGRAT